MPQQHTDTVFDVAVNSMIAAQPAAVYAYVSDLPRCGEWSRECQGGQWIHGEPATLGAVFRGRNRRENEVVDWAPVVRGEWFTEAQVVAADPPRLFSWAMRDSSGRAQESVWSFRIAAAPSGALLSHTFLMRSLTEGMREILGQLTTEQRDRFVLEWSAKLQADMRNSVVGIKRRLDGTPT